jgi:integrase
LKAAGLQHMKFHALRHNASSILRKLKLDPVVRKEILGHANIDMTDEVYGHATSEDHQDAAQEMDRSFLRKEEE